MDATYAPPSPVREPQVPLATQMITILDVHYRGNEATAACVLAEGWGWRANWSCGAGKAVNA